MTFDITNGKYDISSYSCDQMTRGSAQDLAVKGSMVISIGGTPHQVPAGYTAGTVAMSGYLAPDTNTVPEPTCEPDYASEVDPTKCCSHKIDTKDKGSHWYCKPASER